MRRKKPVFSTSRNLERLAKQFAIFAHFNYIIIHVDSNIINLSSRALRFLHCA